MSWKIPAPDNGTATNVDEAVGIAKRIGYPVLLRPSYVLGGRAMVIVYDEDSVRRYMREAVSFSQDRPVLVDRFLEDAVEVDVDALCDGTDVLIAGIMEHIEEAGIHSGDSSCVLPPASLSPTEIRTIEEYTVKLARGLNVIGLMNVQYAIKDGKVYVLEVNPRASRTVPYVSKATGVPLPKLAVQLMLGKKLHEVTPHRGRLPVPLNFVKSPVFPFNKFPGVDPALGPEMRSTGEVMGVGQNFGEAFAKAQLSAGTPLPDKGNVFISVNSRYKNEAVPVARRFAELGFELVATRGTATNFLQAAGLACKTVFKVNEGRPNAVDLLKAGAIQLIVYTTTGALSFEDEKSIRRAAVQYRIPCITTMSGARAAVEAVASKQQGSDQGLELAGNPRKVDAGSGLLPGVLEAATTHFRICTDQAREKPGCRAEALGPQKRCAQDSAKTLTKISLDAHPPPCESLRVIANIRQTDRDKSITRHSLPRI